MITFRRSNPRPATDGGQALVEFALVIGLFMLLVMALVDGGRVLYAQHTINQAAREGVRRGEVAQGWTQGKYDEIRDAVIDAAPGVGLAASDVTGDPGICPVPDLTSPTTCFYPGPLLTGLVAGEPDAQVVVNVRTTVTLVTPLISSFFGSPVTLNAHSEGHIQCSGCESAPAPTP